MRVPPFLFPAAADGRWSRTDGNPPQFPVRCFRSSICSRSGRAGAIFGGIEAAQQTDHRSAKGIVFEQAEEHRQGGGGLRAVQHGDGVLAVVDPAGGIALPQQKDIAKVSLTTTTPNP